MKLWKCLREASVYEQKPIKINDFKEAEEKEVKKEKWKGERSKKKEKIGRK